MRIAICDDLKEYLHQMEKSIEEYLKDKNVQNYQVDKYDNPVMLLDYIEKYGGYDIVLLDICMPVISGTSIAERIRTRQDKTEIVFVTTSDEFAVDAFALKATHYLLKPYTAEEFSEAMNRAFTNFESGKQKKLPIKFDSGKTRFIDISEIIYIESMSHSLTIYVREGEYTETRRTLSGTLEELEQLSPGQFVSPIKGYVVNLKAISNIESKWINLFNGLKIPIARNTFRSLSEKYFKFMFERG